MASSAVRGPAVFPTCVGVDRAGRVWIMVMGRIPHVRGGGPHGWSWDDGNG